MVKKFEKILAAVLTLCLLISLCSVPMTASAESVNLKFDSEGNFKIVVFSDAQDQSPVNENLISHMEQALVRENPDFVVFLGDQTKGGADLSAIEDNIKAILKPVTDKGIPYSFVFGNHDGQQFDKDDLYDLYKTIGDCRTVDADTGLTGTGTCKIPVYASTGNNVAFNLFMLDSGDQYYDNPHDDQVAWLQDNNDSNVNAFVFQHIAMPEARNLLVEDANGSVSYGNKKFKLQLGNNAAGIVGETPAHGYESFTTPTNEFTAIKGMSNILDVFSGHDHTNSFTGVYDGVKMTAVPGMTYEDYGNDNVRGYGVINLNETNTADYTYDAVTFKTLDEEASAPETYEAYDVINYLDLKDASGNPLSGAGTTLAGGTTLTYNRTSPTGSAILKYRWTVGQGTVAGFTGAEMNLSFEEVNSAAAYMFSALFTANTVNFRPYYGFGVNLQKTLASGSVHDIEFAKLKVKTGANTGKYYVYLKIDNEIVAENYTNIGDIDGDGNYTTQPGNVTRSVLSEKIFFACHGTTGNKISQIPDYEYEKYDTVTYWDLTDASGNALAETGTNMAGGTGLKYTPTSSTGSAILKYRWTAGNDINFQLSFGKVVTDSTSITYTFCAWLDRQEPEKYPNGRMWLCPGNSLGSPCFNMPFAIVPGSNHDIEFARLKIKNGVNAGKYYLYIMIDGILIGETYIAENVVGLDGNYSTGLGTTTSVSSGDIAYTCWGISGVKISAIPENETYDTFDEITLSDLGLNPGNFENALPEDTVSSYSATSASYSYVLKFNWRANLKPGTEDELCVSPDGLSNHGKGLWIRGQNFLFGYPDGPKTILPAITSGDHLIEFGRKKVLNGKNLGKYYVYVKVDDVQLADGYIEYAAANNTLSIRGNALANQRFSDFVYPIEYEPYDEVYYSNLKYGGQPVGNETTLHGTPTFTYDRTSETGSAILRYRWTVGSVETQLSIGKQTNGMSYVFGVWVKAPSTGHSNGTAWIIGGSQGEVDLPFALETGKSYDIEFGRLKIKAGHNVGKYYVYYKIDGQLITYTYVGANVVDANGNYIDQGVTYSVKSGEIFMSGVNSKISEIPYTQEYEDYDTVNYEDLSLNGEPVSPNGTDMIGGTKVLTYIPESPTGSAILKYRWTVGEAPAFQLSFGKVETEIAYSFSAWMDQTEGFQNGRMWLCPGNYNREANCAFAIAPNSSHNVEFARLKVKNGPKKGQYHVYIKIDDVLFNEVYAPADTVDENGNFHDYRNVDNNVSSGELLFNFSGSNGSIISAYKDALNGEHLGIRGDFDESGIFNASDITMLKKILLAVEEETVDGISDFNNDKSTDIRDLVAMKKYLAPVNTYTRAESLALGTQEHLLEDSTKTAQYIADASKALGAKSYRLGTSIATLFYPTSVNDVIINEDNLNKIKAQIAALKANGIDEILFTTDAFLLPYNYGEYGHYHNLTIPNPKTEKEEYENWLKVNANAFKKLAQECPEIRFFEPGNELNLVDAPFEKYGIPWGYTGDKSSYKYTVKEKAGIVADLCWNVSNAVKSVNPANQVTTPSISVQNSSAVQGGFTEELYKAIESGAYPSNQTLGDKRIDNYFTILNIHIYPYYNTTNSAINSDMTSYENQVKAFYNVAKAHNDGASRVWITETGLSTSGTKTDDRNKDTVASIITATLNNINTNLTFVDTVFIYKLADVSVDKKLSPQETDYGLFFSGDDLDCAPYGVKPSANAVASFFRGSAAADWMNWIIGVYHE